MHQDAEIRTKLPINPILTIENLSVRLRGQMVLKGINWQIQGGEQWAIIGANGSGKTTLVKTLVGMLPSACGKIKFYPPGGTGAVNSTRREHFGFVSADLHRGVFQREAFEEEIRHFTNDDSIAFTASDFILDRSENVQEPSSARITELERLSCDLGMEALLKKRILALSTGEISKTLILKALLKHPQILILDEPFNGLDQQSKKTIAHFIGNQMSTGLQVILITHRLDEILPEISHVVVMTADGVQKMGIKNEILQSLIHEQTCRIHSDPPTITTKLSTQPANQNRVHLPKWENLNSDPVGTKLVEMLNVTIRYDRRAVLKNVNWEICMGETWVVSGPDGAGKTSLLKLITGENLQGYSNDISLFGQKKGTGESVWETKKNIGWISSDLQSKYPPNIKCVEVVYSGFFDTIGLYGTATAAQRQQARNVLTALGIEKLSEMAYGNLSHGQKQILLIARAIVKSPLLLLLDEPFEGLDFSNCRKIIQTIESISRHTNTAIVYTTPDDHFVLPFISHRLHLSCGVSKISTIGSK